MIEEIESPFNRRDPLQTGHLESLPSSSFGVQSFRAEKTLRGDTPSQRAKLAEGRVAEASQAPRGGRQIRLQPGNK